MTNFLSSLLRAWDGGGDLVVGGLGFLGILWCALRWYWVEREHPLVLLRDRFDGLTRWLLLHRRSPKTLPISLVMTAIGIGMHIGVPQRAFWAWVFQNGPLFLGFHGALVILALVVWITWDREPKYVKYGEGRPDAHFRDTPEEWGDTFVEDGKVHKDPRPTAEILVHRSPTKLARRLVGSGQRFAGNLTLLAFRWDNLSCHVFLVGPQRSGKTASFYAPIMHSSQVPWVYQDSKAELPFREQFSDRPVFGLDVRGHETRSGVWNPMEEIRSPEDFDLIVDYLFPSDPNDKNKWVRDMSRMLFGVLLRLHRWESIQEIARTLRTTRLEPLLTKLDPIYLDTMKDPRSQAIVLSDLVVGLSRWETTRVRSITEGKSTVTLDDYIAKGGWRGISKMNCGSA